MSFKFCIYILVLETDYAEYCETFVVSKWYLDSKRYQEVKNAQCASF